MALEGMPHSGKTTSITAIDKLKERGIILLNEIYFAKEHLKSLEDKKGTIVESKWFIDQEVKRRAEIIKNDLNSCKLILADRTYLSTLAYCYARSKLNKKPKEYEELKKYVNRKRIDFLEYDSMIVFDNDVVTTLNRRDDLGKEDVAYWNNQEFMVHFQNFYIGEINKFCQSKIIRLNVKDIGINDVISGILKYLNEEGIVLRDNVEVNKTT